MDTVIGLSASAKPAAEIHRVRLLPRRPETAMGWALLAALGLAALAALFYAEEDWRGKRAWDACKQSLEAKGGILDWAAFIPRRVPDEQNFFAAPKMTAWFVGRGGNELSGRLDFKNFNGFWQQRATNVLAEVTVVGPSENIAPEAANIVLNYDAPFLTLGTAQGKPLAATPSPDLIPLLVLDEVPLDSAIQALAKQAQLPYTVDPGIFPATPPGPPAISLRWTNLPARQALFILLDEQKLKWVLNAKTGVARVAKKGANDRRVQMDAAAAEQMRTLMAAVLATATNGDAGPATTGAQGYELVAQTPKPIRPARIFVRSETGLTPAELVEFLPANQLPAQARAEAAGGNGFVLRLNGPTAVSAAEYLAWSDPFEADFDAIRQALQRPYALMEGDYEHSALMPIPNFICVRVVAQTLAQRAQCHLLLGQPEPALHDLTLIHDFCRLLEARATGWTDKPMTLVAAMINVAVAGLYVNTVEEGLRLQVWREPDLAAMQQQLQEINLAPYVFGAFETERAGVCHLFETTTPSDFAKLFANGASMSAWDQMKDPAYLFLKLAPRGWVYQNMVKVATLEQGALEGFDLPHGRVIPRQTERSSRQAEIDVCRHSPFTILAARSVPNFTRAVQTLARNQTLANEAQIVCALERYQFAHQKYPAALDALIPQFLQKLPTDVIGGGPLKYHPTDDGKFVLYSIGWKEHDDGGVAPAKTTAPLMPFDVAKGDWIWPYREPMMR